MSEDIKKQNITKIDTSDFDLMLLRSSYFDGFRPHIYEMQSREVYDYEIEFYIESDGGIIVDGKNLLFESGSINFRVPGQIVRGIPPYKCYIICFDIIGDRSKLSQEYIFGTKAKCQPRYDNKILNEIPFKIPKKNCGSAESLIKQIHSLSGDYSETASLEIKGMLYKLIAELHRSSSENKATQNPYIQKALTYIQKSYTENIMIDEISDYLGINVNYFHTIFKNSLGITPKQYINDLRIEKAKTLLLTTNLPISEIADMCGYQDNVYFCYIFKKYENVSPGSYRKTHSGFQ